MKKNIELILIAAVAKNNVIGNNGKIPWKIPKDMKRFKELTYGHPVIMGRTTYFSIPDKFRPLKGRTNIVLTTFPCYEKQINAEGAFSCHFLSKAAEIAMKYGNEVYVIGGEKIYRETIDSASRLELTEIDRDYAGDAFFPKINPEMWKEVARNKVLPDVSFVSYVRK